MNSILRRRRALMGETKDTSILWQIENHVINEGIISTDVQLCSSDHDFSIVYDITIDSIPNSGNSSIAKFLDLQKSGGGSGTLTVQKYGSGGAYRTCFVYMSSSANQITTYETTAGRYKFVINHTKGSGEATAYCKKEGKSVVSKTVSRAFTASNKSLVLGSNTATEQLPSGTLNIVCVRSRALSSDEINEFLGV